MLVRILRIAVLGVLATADTATAQEPLEFWSFLDHGRPITRCAEGSVAHNSATAQLNRLEELFDRLNPSENAAARDALHALLKTECFLFSSEIQVVPSPDSAASAKDWRNRGGFEWLWSYLEYPSFGTLPDLQPHVVLPPEVRRTLTLANARDHALSPFLCSSSDLRCGIETRGWRARAELAFGGPLSTDWDDDRNTRLSSDCLSKAASETSERKYMTWHACLQGNRIKTAAFPIGEFKSPDSGWLVISGRRGHYEFCDSTSAYELETGTALVFTSCSDLALKPDGSVDRNATNKARVNRVRTGSVSIENLREAAWMLLLSSEVKPIELRPRTFPLPSSLEPKLFAGEGPRFISVSGMNTSMTTIGWRLVNPSGRSYSGQQTWARSYEPAEDHAANLINVFEESLVEGCVSRRPPDPSVIRTTKVIALAEDPYSSELLADYSEAYARWRTLKPCLR
jgi:hypothetical protein